MRPHFPDPRLVLPALTALSLLSCQVHLDDNSRYLCASDTDCGGEGYTCVASTAGGYCCKPSPEICDGIDNDCNGIVDDIVPVPCYEGPEGTEGVGICKAGARECVDGKLGECKGQVEPTKEWCNGKDDDCNTIVDDGFDLQTDPANCGECSHPCQYACVAGKCTTSPPPDAG